MNLSVVILAAGRGKRMKSDIPKVLHNALGKPLLQHVVDAIRPLKPDKTVVVIGNGAETVKNRMNNNGLSFIVQQQLLGTGDALSVAKKELKRGTVLVLNGDSPLITTNTLKQFLKRHKKENNKISFLTFIDNSLSGYGRILRDEDGRVTGIIEDKHASESDKRKFTELNGGVYLIETEMLNYLNRIKRNRSSGEYYLTDIIGITSRTGAKLDAYHCSSEEIRGINNRRELYEVSDILRKRYISKWMAKGVTFLDPDTSIIHPDVSIGKDTILYPNTYLEGSTTLGKQCVIYPGARIYNSRLGNGVMIKDNTLIEESTVRNGAIIGPYAHLRPECVIGRDAKIGNFVEIKKSSIGNGSKASHLTYLGDADIGDNVNIGAGTITCNYDGKKKFKTKIESGVFIGSDVQIIAPVTISKGAYVAAGATVTNNVPSGALAISRVKQQNLVDWVKKKRLKPKNKK